MSIRPNFKTMTKTELLAYVLAHREDQAGLYAYLDKIHSENPNPRVYSSEDNITEAITDYRKNRD